jgi:hypothetical protein
VSIWNNPEFQESIRQTLIWAAETTEADAESVRESSTDGDGNFLDDGDRMQCEFFDRKAKELNALLDQIFADGQD